MVELYTLSHPITKQIRYIGKANNARKRLASHMRDARRRTTPLYIWINQLTKQGLCPIIEVIATATDDEWPNVERSLIDQYRTNGHDLLNVAPGGNEPHCTKETRAANGRKTASAIHSDPRKKNIWHIKQKMGQNLKMLKRFGAIDSYNRIVDKCHRMHAEFPDLVPSWGALQKI